MPVFALSSLLFFATFGYASEYECVSHSMMYTTGTIIKTGSTVRDARNEIHIECRRQAYVNNRPPELALQRKACLIASRKARCYQVN